MKDRVQPITLPLLVAVVFITGWHFAVKLTGTDVFPTPAMVISGLVELARKGVLAKSIAASLFRVATGFLLAALVGVPCGLLLGWFTSLRRAFNPALQVLRPISPIAWIPVAILWFGESGVAPVFLIFLASLFPITSAAMAAVQNIQVVYIRAARNFGMRGLELFRKVVFPAALPQILTGLRLALGVSWLMVVAAEMIAANSGLGHLIIDARNAGKRYDLVVAGMLMTGLIGLGLDVLIRQAEKLDEVRWGLSR
ncbi:MAG TPA: ABC transporter permease [Thermoanaerobaculia bacterium]|nr:ABC transporter permease [Thermoanaerobaculia bacterium]